MIDCGAAGMANAIYISPPHHLVLSAPATGKARYFTRFAPPQTHGDRPRRNSLFLEKTSLIRVWKFPVPLRREFGSKILSSRVDQTRKLRWMAGFCEIPSYFPC